MANLISLYSHTPLIIDHYKFDTGGEDDYLMIDIVSNPSYGLGVPAKSLVIENHGGGAGTNRLYFTVSQDGRRWSRVGSIEPKKFETYAQDDGIWVHAIMIWGANANMEFSMRATPGIWTMDELSALGILDIPAPLVAGVVASSGGSSSEYEIGTVG